MIQVYTPEQTRGIYMDDVLMYEPAVPQMSVANSAQTAIYDNNEITVTFNTPIDPTTLDSTKVLVTDTNGKQTPISTFAFDPANPTQFTIGFYEAALEAGRTYHITLDPSVTNIAGISVAGRRPLQQYRRNLYSLTILKQSTVSLGRYLIQLTVHRGAGRRMQRPNLFDWRPTPRIR